MTDLDGDRLHVVSAARLRPAADGAHRATLYGRRMKTHSPKMMWGCGAVVALVIVLAVAGGNAGTLLFALPCMLMMGAMVWMMMGGMRGGHHK